MIRFPVVERIWCGWNMRFSILKILVALSVVLLWAKQSVAQVEFSFGVDVLPFMSLEALRGPTSAVHPLTNANVVLSDSRWRARSSSSTGSTVTFATNHSFWNTTDGATKRDAILRLTRLQGPPTGGWNIDVAQDQTDYTNGDEVATVAMSSMAPGMQMARMEVEFVTGDLNTLQNGNYELTVIGTIGQN